MVEKYIAYKILILNKNVDREALDDALRRVLGCDDTEDDCPMVMMASCGGTLDEVSRWIFDDDSG